MDRRRGVVTVALALLVNIILVTDAMPAGEFHGQGMPGHHPPAVFPPIMPHGFFGFPPGATVPRPIIPRPFPPHAFPPRPFVHHRFIPFGVPAGPVVVYAPSYVPDAGYAPSPGGYYYPDDRSYDASLTGPADTSAAAAPPPMPTVVEYSTGRYELRGDGLTMPYRWVWIPNAPSGPPGTPQGGATFSLPAHHDRLYRWTDMQGVLHVTDRWEAVPPEYRAQAKSPEPS
jgi:Domain of unknown function (DUF4124)